MEDITQQKDIIVQDYEVLSSTISSPPSSSSSVQAAKVPDFEPPQATVSRIIKQVLPDNVQITKEARHAFTRAAGIFIFYITQCANDYSKEHKRSTIYTQDVISALRELDFGEFEAPLEEFLEGLFYIIH
jgi:DNA polymerase epsilon subunit 3